MNALSKPASATSKAVRPCPICGAEPQPLYGVGGHVYLRCGGCTHQFLDYKPEADHISGHYGDEYFVGEGDGYPDYLAERELLVKRGTNYARTIAKLTGERPGRLLDIGSAAGFIAKGFAEYGWKPQGLEPAPAMAQHANENEKIPTTVGDLETFQSDEPFDLILLVQVIAHLEDPAGAFDKVRSLLAPGGRVLIETWDCHSLTARLLKRNWHEYNPPGVLHAFSRGSLLALAEQQGFQSIAARRTVKKIKSAHGKSLIAHKYGGSALYRFLARPALALLPDRLTLPYPADDLFWMLLQGP